MDELTQPQVVQAANQPDMESAASGSSPEGGAGAVELPQGRVTEKPFLTVRYNKQDKPLSREEAAVYAQKGMNYDKVSERLKAAEERIRALGGGEVTAAEQDNQSFQSAVTARDESPSRLRRQPPLGKGAISNTAFEGEGERQEGHGAVRSVQAIVEAQLGEFAAAHPDIDPTALPAPVISAWKRGVPLSEAYGVYRAREEQRQERARTANAVNTAASMGGAGRMGASTPQQITDDAIKAMSPGELDKNHARIWAYLTGKKA
ncbi:MAG: hypothetical protein AAGU77_10850 [Bacillota bacterium]